jgi:5'-3' exonuclease
VDGTNVVMRYALAMLEKNAEPTDEQRDKVLRSVLRSMLGCAQEAEALHMIVALDSAVDSFRREMYPSYKGTRSNTTTTAWSNRLAMYLHERGVQTLRYPGFEGDDIIATLVARASEKGHMTAVLSGDSDLLALSSLFCTVYTFGKVNGPGPRYVPWKMADVAAKYELESAGQLTLFKALVGEAGDNLPGVPGLGPVKAHKLLATLGKHATLDAVAALLSPDEAEQLRLMHSLVLLREDIPLDPIVPVQCKLRSWKVEAYDLKDPPGTIGGAEITGDDGWHA